MKIVLWSLAIIFLSGCSCMAKPEQTHDARCSQKPDVGKCRAYFKRFYFDNAEATCKEFGWGGCGGVVPFETMDECKKVCEEKN